MVKCMRGSPKKNVLGVVSLINAMLAMAVSGLVLAKVYGTMTHSTKTIASEIREARLTSQRHQVVTVIQKAVQSLDPVLKGQLKVVPILHEYVLNGTGFVYEDTRRPSGWVMIAKPSEVMGFMSPKEPIEYDLGSGVAETNGGLNYTFDPVTVPAGQGIKPGDWVMIASTGSEAYPSVSMIAFAMVNQLDSTTDTDGNITYTGISFTNPGAANTYNYGDGTGHSQ